MLWYPLCLPEQQQYRSTVFENSVSNQMIKKHSVASLISFFYDRLVTVWFSVCFLWISCGMIPKEEEAETELVWEALPFHETFPRYFAIQSCVQYTAGKHTTRLTLLCYTTYNKAIQFVLKSPCGIEVMRGTANQDGLVVLDRWSRTNHQWSYRELTKHSGFPCCYSVLQSLLLGTECSLLHIKDTKERAQWSNTFSYVYQPETRILIQTQATNLAQRNSLHIRYRRLLTPFRDCLSDLTGLQLCFSLVHKGKRKEGSLTLKNIIFKKLDHPPKKFVVPACYKRASKKANQT